MRAHLSKLLVAVGACTLAAQLFAAGPVASPIPPNEMAQNITAHGGHGDAEQDTLALINGARLQEGLPPVQWDNRLAEAARMHAALLASNRQLSHQFAGELPLEQRISTADVRVFRLGENVAVNYDAQGAHEAFMNSPGHRANILNAEFDAVGVAAVRDGDLLYVVEDFVHRRPVVSNDDAARALATHLSGMRTDLGMTPLHQVDDVRVQNWACSIANRDQLDQSEGAALPNVALAVAFSTAELGNLPAGLDRMIEEKGSAQYAVGVCYSRTPRFPNGRYFVTMAFFSTDAQPEKHEVTTSAADTHVTSGSLVAGQQ